MGHIKLFEYNANHIEYVPGHEFFNGTQMAKSCGKEIKHWLENLQAAELSYVLARKNGEVVIPTSLEWQGFSTTQKIRVAKQNKYWKYIRIHKGGDTPYQGTYLHKHIAIAFAQWCSAEFALQVSEWVEQLATHGKVILNPTEAADFEKFKQQQRSKLQLPCEPVDEIDLQFRILDWVNLCVNNARFNIEVPMLNSKNKVRRIDFIKNNGRNVIAYELKLNKITLNDVTEAIANREYFELLSNYFNRPITFIFLSPLSIADNATTLLRTMPNIKFQTVHELCYQYYLKGINNKWKNNVVNLTNNMNTNRFSCLFN